MTASLDIQCTEGYVRGLCEQTLHISTTYLLCFVSWLYNQKFYVHTNICHIYVVHPNNIYVVRMNRSFVFRPCYEKSCVAIVSTKQLNISTMCTTAMVSKLCYWADIRIGGGVKLYFHHESLCEWNSKMKSSNSWMRWFETHFFK